MPDHVIAKIKIERAAKKAKEFAEKAVGGKGKKEEPAVEEVVLDAGEEEKVTNRDEL
jgi:hypothetical protein